MASPRGSGKLLAMGMESKRLAASSLALWLAVVAIAFGCGGSDPNGEMGSGGPEVAVPSAPALATVTATPTAEQDVLEAYTRYWDAYSLALLNLDASLVEGVATGDELQRIREEVASLKSQGRAARVVVTHKPVVIEASRSEARLLDEMVNNSFFVDPVTKDPPAASGSGVLLRDTYYFQHVDGRWMVVRSTRIREGG
jgi:hypothetical protein